MTTVSSAVCGWFQDILEGAGCAVAGFWDDLPVDPRDDSRSGSQIEWRVFLRLCERFESRFASREALLAATRETAKARYEAGAREFTGGFGDPRQLYWVAHRWVCPAIFPSFTSDFRDLPNGHVQICLESPADEPAPAVVFEMIQAALVEVPRLIGQPAASVSATCAPGRAEYTVAWALRPVDDAHLREMLDQRITAHGSDLIAQIDDDGVFRYVSPNVETVLGYPAQQMVGHNATEFLRTGDSPDLWRRLAEYLAEPGSSGMRIRTEHADGSPRWFDITGRRAPREDDSVRFILVARDVTEQKLAQRESEGWRERYEVLIEASHRLVYDWNLAEGTVEFRGEGEQLGFAIEPEGCELWDCLVAVDEEVRDRFRDGLTRAIGAGSAFHLEYLVRPGTPDAVLVENDAYPLFDQDGKIRHVTGFVNDITNRHETEEALRLSEERYRIVSELTSDYAFSVRIGADATMQREWITEAYTRITGYRPEELSEADWKDLVHPDDHEKRIGQFHEAIAKGRAIHEYRIIRKSGEVRTMREHARVIHNDDGSLHWYGACRDITEQTNAEIARKHTDERFNAIAQSSHDVIVEFDRTGKTHYISPNVTAIFGVPPEEIVGKHRMDLVHPDDQRQVAHHLAHSMESGESKNLIFRMRNGDGVWRFMDTTATGYRSASGDRRTVMISRDISDRLEMEAERRRLVSIVENSSEFIAVFSTDGRLQFVNEAGQNLLGVGSDAASRKRTIFDCFVPEDSQDMRFRVIPTVIRSGHWGGDVRLRNLANGDHIAAIAHVFLVERRRDGRDPVLAVVARDISERITAERLLRESEARHRMLVESAYDLIAEMDAAGRYVYASPNFETQLGYAPEDLLGESWFAQVHPDHRDRARLAVQQLAETDRSECGPTEMQHADGSWRWMEINLKSYENIRGEPLVLAFFRDITARRHAEEALARSREELLQSQKMEAIGRLAGGIAHDFNNLLTAIIGYCDLLLEEVRENDSLRADAAEIISAANRAAALTAQLLAFSRRQVLVPKVLDLNALVVDVDRLLRRLIGEQIELVTVLNAERPHVELDPGQLEQLIINLAVNARDAMPDGGRLSISTSLLDVPADGDPHHPGIAPARYVTLSVHDTGVGIPPEILSKVFEPFFTTKGGGTGLGLATAYGIIRQSGGEIRAESEVGRGSKFTVYLPWVDSEVDPVPIRADDGDLSGDETILLVEDSDTLRNLLRRSFESHGYRVIDAPSGIDALRCANRHSGPIHLLVTDAVLPKMNGYALARRIRRLRRETKVMFISGFADEALAESGVDPGRITLLRKPFAPADLLRHARRVLAEEPPDRSAAGGR